MGVCGKLNSSQCDWQVKEAEESGSHSPLLRHMFDDRIFLLASPLKGFISFQYPHTGS